MPCHAARLTTPDHPKATTKHLLLVGATSYRYLQHKQDTQSDFCPANHLMKSCGSLAQNRKSVSLIRFLGAEHGHGPSPAQTPAAQQIPLSTMAGGPCISLAHMHCTVQCAGNPTCLVQDSLAVLPCAHTRAVPFSPPMASPWKSRSSTSSTGAAQEMCLKVGRQPMSVVGTAMSISE